MNQPFRVAFHQTAGKDCCTVCGHPGETLHTFEAKDGRVVMNLCCAETCCGDVVREWWRQEPDNAATSMEGVVRSFDACFARGWERHERLALLPEGWGEKVVWFPGPASEESPPPTERCWVCAAPVHSTAPSRGGKWYCESCVARMTACHDMNARLKRGMAKPERLAPPPCSGRLYLCMGDLHGPKV